jgi:hypothetical protein
MTYKLHPADPDFHHVRVISEMKITNGGRCRQDVLVAFSRAHVFVLMSQCPCRWWQPVDPCVVNHEGIRATPGFQPYVGEL